LPHIVVPVDVTREELRRASEELRRAAETADGDVVDRIYE
jgi:hypothetical protein